MNGSEKVTVKALFKFKASNNDELSLKKGEIIIVTQKEDGGWWEGTSRETGKTGWFPSNYVAEMKESTPTSDTGSITGVTVASIDPTTAAELLAQQIENRQQVVRDLIEKEQDFVEEMNNLFQVYLEPLERAEIMPMIEYKQLVTNIEEMIEAHKTLLVNLEEESPNKKSPREQRIGKVLLAHGISIKAAHLTFWSSHPRAVAILEKYREPLDTFMENQGASTPGLMTLTTGLSKPFRQLERYASVSLELEQHMEDDHIDRGDCQRSIGYYKNIAAESARQRRQKEMELEILTGTIRGWEGEELITLGEILHLGPVTQGPEQKDRYFVLFPNTLLILSVSARMSGFIYEGKLPLSGIAVNRLEDTDNVKNSFEITGPMIERIVVLCQTRTESLRWVEILRQQIKCARTTSSLQQHHHPLPPPHKSVPLPASPLASAQSPKPKEKPPQLWKMSCLRPAPPTRPTVIQPDPGSKRNSITVKTNANKKEPETSYEEEMQILRVIEAYCNLSNAKTQRHTFSATNLSSQHNYYENFSSKSPQRRTPLREDSICRLIENSCDDISDEDDEEIELLVEEGQLPILRSSACKKGLSGGSFLEDQFLPPVPVIDTDDDSLSLRDSYPLGAGCLPCTPKSSKKHSSKNLCKHGKSSNWCCGVVASTVKKTTKKL